MKKLNLQTDAEKLRDYINGDIQAELSDSLAEKLERIEFCRAMIEKCFPKYKCIQELLVRFQINRNQAYNLYYETEVVFSIRQIRIEKCLENIAKTRLIALQKQDIKGLAMCDKNEIEAIKQFYGDAKVNQYKNLQPPDMTILYNPKLVNSQLLDENILQQFVAKVLQEYQEFNEPITIDIPHNE